MVRHKDQRVDVLHVLLACRRVDDALYGYTEVGESEQENEEPESEA